ncbi:MAG: helix-turn-helix domain-containing protein [Candidatus Sulfotelmatobacter sp.]
MGKTGVIAGRKAPTKAKQVKPDAEGRQFVGLPTGADMLDLSVPTLRRWLSEGKLTRYKCGGRTLVKTDELLGLVKAQ